MKIKEILAENITKDYYTANIKAEVILDMTLTPVISEILTVVGQNNNNLGIIGKMNLLTKEFPMLKPRPFAKFSEEELKATEGNEYNYRNCNADYLMCDKESVYFVELKTTQESLDHEQMIKYQNYLAHFKNKNFSNVSGAAFIDLLNYVSKTGYSRNSEKPWGETEKDDLKRLFEAIIRYPEYRGVKEIPLAEDWALKKPHHVDDAIAYLKKTKAVSSKKYLLTAGQMLDHMKYGNWWNYDKIKLLYLMPEIPLEKEKTEGVIIVTFQEIMKQAYVIGKEMEKLGLKSYWEWVMKILVQCGLY